MNLEPLVDDGPDYLSWQNKGACLDTPTAFFSIQTKKAKEICKSCVVRTKCLNYALETEAHTVDKAMISGIYGGLTPAERITLRKKMRNAEAAEVPDPQD